ncbi:7-carboxy-7-deazaguanine synthase QueE [Porticoccus sp.]|uniref:7-carboxy-7-deazaguanine synthase QueE n=1 Tax=Porticoccus sp. TaxID=2024853 RepID=UPI000C52692D|nr:7-carboxy-7-deazaguanine synthase QueE [Porticoccus sp.]MAZ69159.1 7-carboxy-7-deazaguanine synthase QueE [Porticoccus sp.]|tara:strand:- start:740 stop:1390 length:651 start_codon:yes stop_codon:yes gene_type:complete
MNPTSVRITEIFYSLQGESSTVGLPTVFVRLTGCPLRCHYCDTEYAFYGGERRSIEQILEEVSTFKASRVCVTGGEPLAQKSCLSLLTALCDKGYQVSLETAGALSIAEVDPRVTKVVDLKTPASGEVNRNLYENIAYLKPSDQIKFVICDRRDYEWARMKLDELSLPGCVTDILFSPSFGQQDATELAEWVLNDRLPVRFQLQLHKLLWKDAPGH